MISPEQEKGYYDQGYFVADDAVDTKMLDRLVEASERAKDKVRSGDVVLGTRIARDGDGSDAEHIEGVFAPEFGEPVFAEYMASEPLLRYVRAFLGNELRLGWMTLCVNSGRYDSGWHRDIGPENREATGAKERDILENFMKNHFKWSLALRDDPCLLLMPGSQRRNATAEERECLLDTRHADISGQQEISPKKGQTLFWNGKTIHRGRTPQNFGERLTVRAGMVKYVENEPTDDAGDRFAWMKADNIRPALPEELHVMYDRWLSVQAA